MSLSITKSTTKANGRFVSKGNSPQEAGKGFNPDYLMDDPGSDRGWCWNLKKLFNDAMENRSMMGFDNLMEQVMGLSNICQKQYYYNILSQAEGQGIVKKTQDRNRRIVVVHLPEG